MKITLDTEFKTREELDSFILSRFGGDSKQNISHEIEVTPSEAEKFSLSDKVNVWGVRVKIKE